MEGMIRRVAATAALLSVLLLLSGCQEAPTTLVVTVTYDVIGTGTPPATTYLYLRLMQSDGTVAWSNEAAPYAVSGLAAGDVFRYVLTPGDGALADPADRYMFDAYFYDTDLSPAAIVPMSPANPGPAPPTGDAERITREATWNTGFPVAPDLYRYNGAAHLLVGLTIQPGTQKHLLLTAYQDFP